MAAALAVAVSVAVAVVLAVAVAVAMAEEVILAIPVPVAARLAVAVATAVAKPKTTPRCSQTPPDGFGSIGSAWRPNVAPIQMSYLPTAPGPCLQCRKPCR